MKLLKLLDTCVSPPGPLPQRKRKTQTCEGVQSSTPWRPSSSSDALPSSSAYWTRSCVCCIAVPSCVCAGPAISAPSGASCAPLDEEASLDDSAMAATTQDNSSLPVCAGLRRRAGVLGYALTAFLHPHSRRQLQAARSPGAPRSSVRRPAGSMPGAPMFRALSSAPVTPPMRPVLLHPPDQRSLCPSPFHALLPRHRQPPTTNYHELSRAPSVHERSDSTSCCWAQLQQGAWGAPTVPSRGGCGLGTMQFFGKKKPDAKEVLKQETRNMKRTEREIERERWACLR